MSDKSPLKKRVRDAIKASEEADRLLAEKATRQREAARRSRDAELKRLKADPDRARRLQAAEQDRLEAAARQVKRERPLRELEDAITEFCQYARWRLLREFKIDGPVRRVRRRGWIILPRFKTEEVGPYVPDAFDGGSSTYLPGYTQIVAVGLTTHGEVVKLASGRNRLVRWSAARVSMESCLREMPSFQDQLVDAIARKRRFGSHSFVDAGWN